ncbi:MAG TPA: acyl carrier protein [Bacteroidales bacterium]|nr:acyl carrier protein [Bacteroidales bacterium]HPS17652.1 acyl carrier protein [Bacteroidales bacterium]
MKNKIIEILKELRPEFDFMENSDFIEQGMLDSFDIVNLVTSLDKHYGISIDGMDIIPKNFSSIAAIISLLKKNGVSNES